MSTASIPHSNLSRRLLLVEDHEINRLLLADYLTYCGYEVLTLSEGALFATAIAKFQPHLIVLDLKLPDTDGYTLLQQLQQHGEWSRIPVIVVSAFAFRADQRRALNLGARHYLVKPIQLLELKQLLAQEFNLLSVS